MPAHKKIQERRKALGISQVELARRLRPYLPGIDDSDISRIETGRRKLLADEVPAFATVFGCDVMDLMDERPIPQ